MAPAQLNAGLYRDPMTHQNTERNAGDGRSQRLAAVRQALASSGEAGQVALSTDWTATAVGPMESWPESLLTAVGICFSSLFPMLLWWGPELVMFYNDAYAPMLGVKHPRAMGSPVLDIWPEVWDVIGPMLEEARNSGRGTWADDQLLLLERHGFAEECYFTFSFSPIWDDAGTAGGVFCAVTETTLRVIGERRLRTLRSLAESAAEPRTASEVTERAVEVIAENPADLPYTLIYLLEEDGTRARLAAATGLAPGGPAAPELITLEDHDPVWPVAAVLDGGLSQEVPSPVAGPEPPEVTPADGEAAGSEPEPTPVQTAILQPLTDPAHGRPAGVVITGVSARRPLDEDYRSFLTMVAGHIETALAEARAWEAERERVEALAALDRSKTEFFTSISHEFRTPLTLMLGPITDALSDPSEPLGPRQRERIEIAERNAERLLKLVGSLLDFSRLEAGRLEADYEPTDLGQFTRELAGVFQSAADQAALRLTVDCGPVDDAWVDRDMWERIVLNLLSNAFKFTLEGEISVTLHQAEGEAVLTVSDTGPGIPQAELSHLFERFHRVQGTRGRTHEGAGIGLALVSELTALHGGEVSVESTLGTGSTFTVRIPTGSAHLPEEHLRPAGFREQHDLNAVVRAHLGDVVAEISETPTTTPSALPADSARVLVAEDNADMRAYLSRMLADHWQVEAVPDGEAALASALKRPPDLLLTDVMMPRMDGFALLAEMRRHPQTEAVPVVMLSARAGEEASISGLEAGADDYLVKPFSARELVARVRVHLALARARADAIAERERAELERRYSARIERFRQLAEATTDLVAFADARARLTYLNAAGRRMLALPDDAEILGRPASDFMAEDQSDERLGALAPTLMQGRTWHGETTLRAGDGALLPVSQVVVPQPGGDEDATAYGTIARDISDDREREEALRKLALLVESSNDAIIAVDAEGSITEWNPAAQRLFGYAAEEALGRPLAMLTPPELAVEHADSLAQVAEGHKVNAFDTTRLRRDGSPVAVSISLSPIPGADGTTTGVCAVCRDVTERKALEARLQYLADHDALTGLFNRRRFEEEIDRELARSRRNGEPGALLAIDLDNFKFINDSLGHAAGDELITHAAAIIGRRLRANDVLCRFGGDEFGVLLASTDVGEATVVAEALLEALRSEAGRELPSGSPRVSASIGLTTFGPDEPGDVEQLLVEADIAMYDAKEAGRDRVARYASSSDRHERMSVRLTWADRIRSALAEDRFVLYAQPIVALAGDPTPHYELLLRMIGEDGTLIAPDAFLAVAERFDLIGDIDRWVLHQGIRHLARQQQNSGPVQLSLNLSARTSTDPALPGVIERELAAAGADPHGLCLEVTETAAITNLDRARRLATRLGAMGCEYALDDFGTGFASFSYLKHLRYDYLKIDVEFIRDLPRNRADQLVVRSIVDIARGLHKRVIAEGVSDAETVELLRTYGAHYAQGYHIAVPTPLQATDLSAAIGV